MIYKRIIPRDFFNESKLLKCLGRLSLNILECKTNDITLVEEFDNECFDIYLDENNGYLYVLNYKVYYEDEEIFLYTPYNSKENYPLYGIYKEETYLMLDDLGNFLFKI